MNRLTYPYCATSVRLWLAIGTGLLLTGLALLIARGGGGTDSITLSGLITLQPGQVVTLGWILVAVFGGGTAAGIVLLAAMVVRHREIELTASTISAPPHWLSFSSRTIALSAVRQIEIEGRGRLAALAIEHTGGRLVIPSLFLAQPYGLIDLEEALKLRLRSFAVRPVMAAGTDGMFGSNLTPARVFGRRV